MIFILGRSLRLSKQAKELESHIRFSESTLDSLRPTLRLYVIAVITATWQKQSHLPCSCLKMICFDKYPLYKPML